MKRRFGFFSIAVMVVCCSSVFAASFDLDIDDDGEAGPLTDGLLVIRYLFGFSGDSLVSDAVAEGALRRDPEELKAYLEDNQLLLDVDGDGKIAPLSDGLLIIRSLFGFSGNSLTSGAIGDSATRTGASDVESYLETITDSDNDGANDAFDAFPRDPNESLDTDGDGVGNNEDALPNDPSNFTDSDRDGVYDYFDVAPNDPDIDKAIIFNFSNVSRVGVSERINEEDSPPGGSGRFGQHLSMKPIRAKGRQVGLVDIGETIDSGTLINGTNLIGWSGPGAEESNIVASNESIFISEAVLTPDGSELYLLTSPSVQRAINEVGNQVLDVDQCQLYKITLASNRFSCVLDDTAPEIFSHLLIKPWRDDYLHAGINFRADGVGLLETQEGPLLLQRDGSFTLYNETERETPEGFRKSIEHVLWLDDQHIAVQSSIYPIDGGEGARNYWTAFNIVSGEEVAEIEADAIWIVKHGSTVYTANGNFRWDGSEFISGASDSSVQDNFGNLWARTGDLSIRDDKRGLVVLLGETGTSGPDDNSRSGTGTRLIYGDFAFEEDWVLLKYSRKATSPVISIEGETYLEDEPMFIDLASPNGSFIKLASPDLWYYLRSGEETADVSIGYQVALKGGGVDDRNFILPIEAIESFKDFDPNIYQTSSYDSGYELLQELGEGVALEMPNPEPEEVTFCLFQISTSRQMCALLSDYKVSRTDFENIINNSERHFPADYYACPDGSCSATPGVQNIVFGADELVAFFKDSRDNQYYRASAPLESFMARGDDALTVTPVINGAGESEIIAQSSSLVAAIQQRIVDYGAAFNQGVVRFDIGINISTAAPLPDFVITSESGETIPIGSIEIGENPQTFEIEVLAGEALQQGQYEVKVNDFIFSSGSPLRFGVSEPSSLVVD